MAETAGLSYLSREGLPFLAYISTSGVKSPGVIYVPGFMTGMGGNKIKQLEPFVTSLGHSYLRYDPTGLYASTDPAIPPTPLSVHRWNDDLLLVIDQLTVGPQVLVGSSMGAWLSILAAMARPERVSGLLLISSAPDCFQRAYDGKLTDEQRATLEAGQTVIRSNGNPITMQLVNEGRELGILAGPKGGLSVKCPTRLVQSDGDEGHPVSMVAAFLSRLDPAASAELRALSGGGHSFDSPREMGALKEELEKLLKLVEEKWRA